MIKTLPAGAYIFKFDQSLKFGIVIENHLGQPFTLCTDTSKCPHRGMVIENNGCIRIGAVEGISPKSAHDSGLLEYVSTIKTGTFRFEYLELV